ncbi:unnamed protein product, partial [Ectocarpus fasciculatus]
IFIADAQSITAASADRQPLDGGGTLRLMINTEPAVNAAGQLAFAADILDDDFRDFLGEGLFYYDPDAGLLEIARAGDAFAGGTLDSFSLAGNRSFIGTTITDDDFGNLNDAGQLAFTFELTDGRTGIARWTPEV